MSDSESSHPTSQILIVAAEASSSLYGERLLEHWKAEKKDLLAFGIGSRKMESLGFECMGRSEELAVVGIQEVLTHYGEIRRTFFRLLDEAQVRRPKVALLMDYPDFNLRLAKRLKKLGIPVVYYISPQVWAWRKSRIKTIRKWVDQMLVLFPFEKEFYERSGVKVEFVGHPLIDELSNQIYSSEEEVLESRRRLGIDPNDVVLGLMPGSRRSELKHHLQIQMDTAERLVERFPKLKVLLLVAPTLTREEVKELLGDYSFPLILVCDHPLRMVQLTDLILCASGTATLTVGLMKKPMVIIYRMSPLTAFIARRFVTTTPFFGMVNLIMNREVVPERFQEEVRADLLAEELSRLIESPERRAAISKELEMLSHLLGNGGTTRRVAEILQTEYLM